MNTFNETICISILMVKGSNECIITTENYTYISPSNAEVFNPRTADGEDCAFSIIVSKCLSTTSNCDVFILISGFAFS